MKVSDKSLEELIVELIGEDALPLVKLLRNKVNISEFLIADKLKISINHVRNILYRLQNHNLVSFTRKKDKKKGWYIYYWTLNVKRARELLVELKKNKLERLYRRLERETQNNFFVCPNKCIRLDEDTAMSYEYKCQECNEILVKEDNTKVIEAIKKEIEVLENRLKEKEVVKRKRVKRPRIRIRKPRVKKKLIKKKVVKKRLVKKLTKRPKGKKVRKVIKKVRRKVIGKLIKKVRGVAKKLKRGKEPFLKRNVHERKKPVGVKKKSKEKLRKR